MITRVTTRDLRFPIGSGHGSDAIHRNPVYSYAVVQLHSSDGKTGSGLAFTLGAGNELVCRAAEWMAQSLVNRDIGEIMARFGEVQRGLADEQQLRWLGPHKGVVHLALASLTNACWDLWTKTLGQPLWDHLLSMDDEALLDTMDFSYIEDALSRAEAGEVLSTSRRSRQERIPVLADGYPGYDTSIGWFNYSDEQVAENVRRSAAEGFDAMKLKVGSSDIERDVRRARLVRDAAGPDARVMADANQQWSVREAIQFAERTSDLDLFWIEEPTHPDDVLGHREIARCIGNTRVAAGEHVPNRVVFKNYFNAEAMAYCQVDALRVAGISEFLVVSLMARKYGIPLVPHVGDMGQIHQHLVLFNHIAMDHPLLFLEYIPHLRDRFTHPATLRNGRYVTPSAPGIGGDLV
ncbi:MAG: hypothetical protein JJU00_08065 [Opitutales bacterium]|nr:hypothetical protein [Opitutales bacterium]